MIKDYWFLFKINSLRNEIVDPILRQKLQIRMKFLNVQIKSTHINIEIIWSLLKDNARCGFLQTRCHFLNITSKSGCLEERTCCYCCPRKSYKKRPHFRTLQISSFADLNREKFLTELEQKLNFVSLYIMLKMSFSGSW